jgi:hypothetical protein
MASVKTAYGSSAALTITLASLASSSTLVAGRASTAVSNTTNLYRDYLLAGVIRAGTTPTAGQINVYVYGSFNDTPVYPDAITGTDAAKTITSTDIRNSGLVLIASITTDTTTGRDYPMAARSIANCFGGVLPKNWGVWVTHSMVAALDATGGNHVLSYTGVYETVA